MLLSTCFCCSKNYYSDEKKNLNHQCNRPPTINYLPSFSPFQHCNPSTMFGIGKSSSLSSSTRPIYFDIRVKSTYKNLIIVRGSHYESPSVVVSGDLVFSLPEPITVKRVGLKLVGKYKLDFLEVLEEDNTTISNPVKEDTVVFEVSWDNLLLDPNGIIKKGVNDQLTTTISTPTNTRSQIRSSSLQSQRPSLMTQGSSSSSSSLSSTTRRLNIRSQSTVTLQLTERGITGTPFIGQQPSQGTLFSLLDGNYELPFKCVLPGDIPETVEGLMAGSILYKFEAIIERTGFNKSPVAKHKYFRILRTLSSDNLALNETISIGKSWPDKVQYEVSIPSRAVPIGGTTPLHILLVPLTKNLKIGLIKAQIVQLFAFRGVNGEVYDDEHTVLDCTMSQMENTILDDKISIDSFLNIPSNLKKITQDCDFKQDFIKVRHKLKLQINLINPSGNISELRANIPITLFISPSVEMTGRMVLLDKHGKIHFRKDEEKLFERNGIISDTATNREPNNSSSNFTILNNDDVPPNYDEHIHDRILFTENNSNITNSQNIQEPQINEFFGEFMNNTLPASPTIDHYNHNYGNNHNQETVSIPSIELELLQKRLKTLKYETLTETPSYEDAMEDQINVSEELSPSYHNVHVNRRLAISSENISRNGSNDDLIRERSNSQLNRMILTRLKE